MLRSIQILSLAFLLAACSAVQFVDENDILVRKIVEQGAMRYIQARPEVEWHSKAVRVREVAQAVKSASTSEFITLEKIREIALDNLNLTPADMELAGGLFDTIAAVAEQQIQEDMTEVGVADHPATYRKVADWVIAATRYYPETLD